MKLYYMAGACPLATHIVLEWTGAPYMSERLSHDDLKKEAYLRVNPLGAVPALEVDGSVITQNAGVLSYLADTYPEAKLGGDGTPRGDAEVHRWLGFVNSDIHPAFKPLFGSTAYLGVSTAEQNPATRRRKSRPLGAASGERREGVARPEFPACGIGLYMARMLARMQDGDVRLDAGHDDRVTFTLVLPRMRAGRPKRTAPSLNSETA